MLQNTMLVGVKNREETLCKIVLLKNTVACEGEFQIRLIFLGANKSLQISNSGVLSQNVKQENLVWTFQLWDRPFGSHWDSAKWVVSCRLTYRQKGFDHLSVPACIFRSTGVKCRRNLEVHWSRIIFALSCDFLLSSSFMSKCGFPGRALYGNRS